MKIIILAGGSGTRLFPLSRSCYPKQFLKLGSEKSLLVQTVDRFLPLVQPSDIVVVTNRGYTHHVKAELASCGVQGVHLLYEPDSRNTAPAILLAIRYCLDQLGVEENEEIFVTPSDHFIGPQDAFARYVSQAVTLAAKGSIVTFGIHPIKPETGYGYIRAGEPYKDGYRVISFKEKPDLDTACQYLSAGGYYWNSGMFAFTIKCFLNELADYQPEIFRLASVDYQQFLANFNSMPNISIDYAVAEKSSKTVVIPFTASWNDIGSWDAIYDVLKKDGQGNALQGDCLALGCSGTLMLGSSRLIAGVGLEDVLLIETDDVIVVAKKGESQKVRELVNELKLRGRREPEEHTTMYRPWGSYTVLGEGPGYKMKKIVVTPGQRLSLQMHYHRSEHWVVIGGTAKVTVGDKELMVHRNESVFIPPSTRHRLENPGKLPLEIIEVQNGDYLKEDDIVRFEDSYGRS